ncbi:3-keto-disaccharide hydrolase [Mucilaginibacter aquaedulcis]|uniref:3-keto-disaccharide hydrolase n=1 Tax=Mucilaginibacter aquaedulcis TaxID=1187081 RepID=UPI0025B5CCDF|nr:DUF1080 domain-containing protein [Mucilaginibacter aquaedulcis]MDN3550902.1 DUF1080 domain-containing protein [Mucilaginibacter aquaedulcis]
MKKIFLGLMAIPVLHFGALAQTKGYKPLFDGKTTTGWHTYLKTNVTAWKAVDGTLQLDPNAEGQGDLVTNDEYENYELKLDWKISETGNSGIIFGVHEDPKFSDTYLTGVEMQVLDNQKASDNKKATHLAGSLYDLKAPSADVAKPAGEWNAVVLRKKDGHLTFWLNGTKIVEIQIGGEEWKQLVANSKFKDWADFAKYPKGHIALQDHNHEVAFRNIYIKQL